MKKLLREITAIFAINLLIFTSFVSSANAQIISSNTSDTVTIADGEDFVINAGVTLSNTSSVANAGTSGSPITLENFTNNGNMTGSASGGAIMNAFNSDVKTNFINNGTMLGKGGINFYSAVTLTNNASKSISGSDRAIHFQSGSAGTDLTNNGSIQGNYSSIKIYSGVTINSLTNGSTGSIGGTSCNNIYAIELYGTITTLTNNGSIRNCNTNATIFGPSGSPTITTLKNYGTISNANSSLSISGTSVTNLFNSQSNFKFSGNLPSNYFIFINGSKTGKITFSSFGTSSLVFGIDPLSTLSNGTYSAVVNGISASNISSGTSGTFGGKNWTLTNSTGTQWDLVVTDSDSTDPTLSSSTPEDNAPSVAIDSNIVLNFSEIVDVKSGNITIKKTSDNSTVETISVTDTNKVTGTGSAQITINPSANLVKGTEYHILIDATAFDDQAGNSYAGISSTTVLSFTTESMVDPTTDKEVVGSINAQSQLAKNFISQSISTVSNRLSYLRHNRAEDQVAKNNIKLDFGNPMLAALTNKLLVKNDKSITPKDWSLWSEGSISNSKIGDSANSSSIETDGRALAIGFDKKLNNNDLLGFAIQYGQSDTDIGSNGTNIDSKNYNISVYRTLPLKEDNFVEGLIGVGTVKNDLTRKSGANTLTGSRNGTQIFGSINYGKTIDKGDFNLTPIARVDLGYTELDAYSETGTDALSYAKQTVQSGLASVGLEFSDIVKLNQSSFKPFGAIEYGMDFSNSSNAKMNYVSDTSTIYTYTQGANSNHLITTKVGFEYIVQNNLNVIATYKRIQGNESEKTDIVKFGVNFKTQRETEYAISIDGSEDLKAGFNISKNINGLNLSFNAKQSFVENSDYESTATLSKIF